MKLNKVLFAVGTACLLTLNMTAQAAPVQISISGNVGLASGDLAYLLGSSFSANYIIDTDLAMATTEQHNHPFSEPGIDNFDAWAFTGAPYGMTISIPHHDINETMSGVEVKVYDNDTTITSADWTATSADWTALGLPAGAYQSSFDVIEVLSGDTIANDPNSPLYAAQPEDGTEYSLNLLLSSDWVETHSLTSLNPPAATDILAMVYGATKYDANGDEIGTATAIILPDNASVSPVPVPAALPLFASVLGVMGFYTRRRKC